MAEIILPAKFVFFKTNIFLLSGLFNMIIGSVGRWVGGSVSQWSLVGGRWILIKPSYITTIRPIFKALEGIILLKGLG